MEDKVSHIPVLRFGEPYKSLDTNDLGCVLRSGARLEVSVANAGIIRRDKRSIEKARAAARRSHCRNVLRPNSGSYPPTMYCGQLQICSVYTDKLSVAWNWASHTGLPTQKARQP